MNSKSRESRTSLLQKLKLVEDYCIEVSIDSKSVCLFGSHRLLYRRRTTFFKAHVNSHQFAYINQQSVYLVFKQTENQCKLLKKIRLDGVFVLKTTEPNSIIFQIAVRCRLVHENWVKLKLAQILPRPTQPKTLRYFISLGSPQKTPKKFCKSAIFRFVTMISSYM